MTSITLNPLSGISIFDTGEIMLGYNVEQVEKIIGKPSYYNQEEQANVFVKQAYYDNFEMRIDYNKHDKVEFIEFLFGPWPEKTILSIYGINPFAVYGDELIKILSTNCKGEVDIKEAPYCYVFTDISVGIWREADPSEVEAGIAQKKKSAVSKRDIELLDEELEKAKRFWTIGLGNKEYYN